MSEIRRVPRVLALLVCGALLAMCAGSGGTSSGGGSTNTSIRPGSAANPCSGKKGNGSPNTPIVCVDDTGDALTVHPDPVIVHDRSRSDNNPVMIQWMTVSGSDNLNIVMNPGCTTEMKCNKHKCTAKTIPFAASETGEHRCKYTIKTDRLELDPDTVVVKCCTVPDPTNP